VQQNFWADPPVARGLKARPHHRQHGFGVGFFAASSAEATGSPLNFVVIAGAEVGKFGNCSISSESSIQTIYTYHDFSSTIYDGNSDYLSIVQNHEGLCWNARARSLAISMSATSQRVRHASQPARGGVVTTIAEREQATGPFGAMIVLAGHPLV
jgi:hypothetical protein